MMQVKLPAAFKQYFWDVDFDSLKLEESKSFILKRVLDRGDTEAICWLKEYYNGEDIKNLLQTTRDLSPQTANFWADYLGLNHQTVPCLQKPYSRIPFGLSS